MAALAAWPRRSRASACPSARGCQPRLGMCGYNFVSTPGTTTDVEELPYNPNHVVGLKAGTYLTAVIFEVKSSSIFTERNQH